MMMSLDCCAARPRGQSSGGGYARRRGAPPEHRTQGRPHPEPEAKDWSATSTHIRTKQRRARATTANCFAAKQEVPAHESCLRPWPPLSIAGPRPGQALSGSTAAPTSPRSGASCSTQTPPSRGPEADAQPPTVRSALEPVTASAALAVLRLSPDRVVLIACRKARPIAGLPRHGAGNDAVPVASLPRFQRRTSRLNERRRR